MNRREQPSQQAASPPERAKGEVAQNCLCEPSTKHSRICLWWRSYWAGSLGRGATKLTNLASWER